MVLYTGGIFVAVLLAFASPKRIVRDGEICEQDVKSMVDAVSCDWYYMFYMPRLFSTGRTENFIVSTHKYKKPVNVKVTLRDSNKVVYAVKEELVNPEIQTELKVYIGPDAPESLTVIVEGFGKSEKGYDWYFRNSSDPIRVQRQGYSIFIQTDRPIYKPGQKIQGRVVVINSTLHPVKGELEKIIIESPSGTRMRQWNNVELKQGIAPFELVTSDKPVLGKWTIKAKIFGITKEVEIELKEYVLPKFQVTVVPPSFLTISSTKMKFVVCAKYSYGKSVFGTASIRICRKHSYYYSWLRNTRDTCIKRSLRIYGCKTVTVQTNQLEFIRKDKNPYSSYRFAVNIDAEVQEKATGIKLQAKTVTVPVETSEVFLSFETRESFKPGLPLSIKLFAKYPDGTPIESVDVTLNAGTGGASSQSNIINKEKITIKNGVYNVKLPPIPYDARKILLNAEHVRDKLYPEEDRYRRSVNTYEHISPWYSPTHSYIQIEKPTKPVKKGENAKFTVFYTMSDQSPIEKMFYYSIMCAGNIAKTGNFKQILKSVPRNEDTVDPSTSSAASDETSESNENTRSETSPILPFNLTEKDLFSKPTRPPLPKSFSSNSFVFSFDVTKNMYPFCRMVVYYIREKEIVADSIQFDTVQEFDNKVSIGFSDDEVKPADEVTLIMKGYPGSQFSLTAVDKSIHFLADGNDIKPKDLEEVRKKQDITPGYYDDYSRCPFGSLGRKRRSIVPFHNAEYVDSEKAFLNIGSTVMTNLHLDVRPCVFLVGIVYGIGSEQDSSGDGEDGGSSNRIFRKGGKKSVRPRVDFPDTWIFKDGVIPENGRYKMTVKVPDTITNWYASGFAMSQDAGLGVAKATELTVFQPFFISLNLPYSVIRGEDVTIPTAVFSYLEKSCVSVKISLTRSNDFRLVAGPSAQSCLCGGRTTTVLFRIVPKKLGHIPIQVKAETIENNICSSSRPYDSSVSLADIVIKKLFVKAEGIKKDYVQSDLICAKNPTEFETVKSISIDLPRGLVPGSIFSKFAVIGDILGSSIENLESLLQMPYGCGEQNMLKFAPNIYILDYLSKTNQLNDKIKNKALNFLRTGYQRELTFKRKDGSYSAFGERDSSGSTWLTAFVLKSYAQAQTWIDIDDKEISDTTQWLFNHQSPDGCFESIGMLHNKRMKGGIRTPVTLTAYVLTSLLEAGYDPSVTKARNAKNCIAANLRNINDVYSLCIIAYTAIKAKDNLLFSAVLKKLEDYAVKDDGMLHYAEKNTNKEFTEDSYYYQAPSFVIEQTAYMLLATVKLGGYNNINDQLPLVRYLSVQRNSLGGWASTQDTVLALQALAEFAGYAYGGELDMSLRLESTNEQHEFEINEKNNLVLQTAEDFDVPSVWKIKAKGKGCAVMQAIIDFNVKKEVSKPAFKIDVSVSNIKGKLTARKSCLSQRLKICASWLLEKESNMAVVDVAMVSGFQPEKASLNQARQFTKGMKEVEVKGNNVHFYFNRLSNDPRCFELIVHQTSNIRGTKPVPITVYDYYDKELSATELYEFTSLQCTRPN